MAANNAPIRSAVYERLEVAFKDLETSHRTLNDRYIDQQQAVDDSGKQRAALQMALDDMTEKYRQAFEHSGGLMNQKDELEKKVAELEQASRTRQGELARFARRGKLTPPLWPSCESRLLPCPALFPCSLWARPRRASQRRGRN